MTTQTAKANYIAAKAAYMEITGQFETRESRRENRSEIVDAYEAKVKAECDLVDMGFEKLEKSLGKNMNETLNSIISDCGSREYACELTIKYI
jgi:hypothetical protein